MRVVFLGTSEFSVPSLEALMGNSFDVVGVVTQPDRPAGRGHGLRASPIKTLAESAAIPVFQPGKLRNNPEAVLFLQERRPELMVIVAFGQILPPEFFDFSRFGTLNVHASLLPRYRGAAPVAHALMKGEKVTGVTIIKIDEGMDTGDILSQARVPIDENVTAGELEDSLARKGAELLLPTISGYARGEIEPCPQDHGQATHAPRVQKEEGRINWTWHADEIHNRIRALNPWPVTFTMFRGQKLKIWRSRKQSPSGVAPKVESTDPGEVVMIGRSEIVVQCGGQSLLGLEELQLPNRKRLSSGDFANGVALRVGEIVA